MIQFQEELQEHIQSLKSFQSQGFIQKIYSTSTVICMTLRIDGQTSFLYFGRGRGVEGFWVHKDKPESLLRKKDKFLDYLRNRLTSTLFDGIEQVYNDRCICLYYRKHGKRNCFYFFWKGRNLYFMNSYFKEDDKNRWLFKSWEMRPGIIEEDEDLEKYLLEIGLQKSFDRKPQKSKTSIAKILVMEKEKIISAKPDKRKQKSLKRKVENIENDLLKMKSIGELKNKLLVDDLKLEGGNDRFKFKGLTIKLKKDMSHYQKRDLIFKKIKSMEKIIPFLEERLRLARLNINPHEEKVFQNTLKVVEPIWFKEDGQVKKALPEKEKVSFKVHTLVSGIKFAIGENAKGNDEMRNSWAKKEDTWIHLDGVKSSHIIIKIDKLTMLSNEELESIVSLLRDVSKYNGFEIPILYTQVKNLKPLKGKQGSVTYKKEKYLKIIYNQEWEKLIK